MKTLFDPELLFQMLGRKDWDALSEVIYNNRTTFKSDPVIQHALKLFESEFFNHLDELAPELKVKRLKHVSLLIEFDNYSFSRAFVERAIDSKLLALYESKSPSFAGYASQHFTRPLAQDLLQKTHAATPEQLAHARRPAVSVKAKPTRAETRKTTKLFKSQQEANFYAATRAAFPQYLPYPNVAVSAVIDFDAIKAMLTAEVKTYFYKAQFDCVVFDPTDGHEPLYFFELDSKYHDHERAVRNDEMKDTICRSANVKLTRIRAFDPSGTTVEAFCKLVRELVTSHSA